MKGGEVLSSFGSVRRRWSRLATIESEQLALAGPLSGVLYLTGAVTVALILLLPGVTDAHWPVVLALAAAAGIWGVTSVLVIHWYAAPAALIYVSTSIGFAVIAAAIVWTDGSASPTRVCLYFRALFLPCAST